LPTYPPVDLPLIGEIWSLQIPFLLLVRPGIFVALWMMTVKEPPRRGSSADLPSFSTVISHLFAHKGFYLDLFFGASCLTLLFNGIAFWFLAHLIRSFGVDALFSWLLPMAPSYLLQLPQEF